TDLMGLAVASPTMVADAAEIGTNVAQKIIIAAREAVDIGGFETGDVILERRKSVAKLTTCSKALDELLGGGLETQAITEMYGEFGSGKSQIGHQLAVNVTRPEDDGGLNGDTVWIDTEQTFRPERIRHMADALDLDADAILERIHVAREFDSVTGPADPRRSERRKRTARLLAPPGRAEAKSVFDVSQDGSRASGRVSIRVGTAWSIFRSINDTGSMAPGLLFIPGPVPLPPE